MAKDFTADIKKINAEIDNVEKLVGALKNDVARIVKGLTGKIDQLEKDLAAEEKKRTEEVLNLRANINGRLLALEAKPRG